MDDQLDNDLRNRIREVFDNYEDTSADEGWLLLREKYPEKEKRRIIAWLWWAGPVAALLLLFLGIYLFKITPGKPQQAVLVKKQALSNPGDQGAEKKNKYVAADSLNTSHTEEAFASTKNNGRSNTGSTAATTQRPAKSNSVRKTDAVNGRNSANYLSSNKSGNNAPGKKEQTNPQEKTELMAAAKPADQAVPIPTPDKKENNLVATKLAPQAGAAVAATPPPGVNMKEEQTKKANSDIFADNNTEYKKSTKSPKEARTVSFGVYAATYVNYAKGSTNQFNMGAGVSSDIRLTKNLNFSTGISVGQNTLSYTSQLPSVPVEQFAALAPTSATASAASFSPSRLVYTNTSPAFRNYNADLVGLDIPLNLKFVFDPQKTGTYILAGISSGTFINETYTYSYNSPSLFSASISQVQNQSTSSSFSNFYFAKSLNFAFGTGYAIGRNRLVLEPFLKYPLQGLGVQQLRFGAGGVNVKINILERKK